MKKGKLIVIEGTDSSGKETQSKLLVERLNKEGIKSKLISFPRYETPAGRIVGECYLGKKLTPEMSGKSWFENPTLLDPYVASLYYAADRRAAVPCITEILKSGTHIIANRYVESNMGHQGGKTRGKDRFKLIKDLDDLEHNILKIPRPNGVIFLYMPWQVAKILKERRGGHQDAHEASDEHLINAEETYINLAEWRNWSFIYCTSVEGAKESPRTKEEISEEVYKTVKPILIHH